MLLFTPTEYETDAEIKSEFQHASARSDTIIDEKEVFGFVGDTPFEAIKIFDESAQDWFWIAGDPI